MHRLLISLNSNLVQFSFGIKCNDTCGDAFEF